MKDAYIKLMVQQHTNGDAAFMEKLEHAQPKKKPRPVLRAAIVAACICLIIPVTVYAVTHIFNTMHVTKTERPTLDNNPGIGMDIFYEDIAYYPLSAFSPQVQELKESTEALYDSWTDAEAYLGIDLLNNSLFTAEDYRLLAAWKKPGKVCNSFYYVWDGIFSGATVCSVLQHDRTEYVITARAMAEHAAEYDETIKLYYHGSSFTYRQYPVREVSLVTEEYVTKAGIPVLLVIATREGRSTEDWDSVQGYTAFFAVNNISYRVDLSSRSFGTDDMDTYSTPFEKYTAGMKEILDGFVIE